MLRWGRAAGGDRCPARETRNTLGAEPNGPRRQVLSPRAQLPAQNGVW